MDRNKLKIILAAATAFFLIVGVIVFVLCFVLDISTLLRIILGVVAFLCLALVVEGAYFTYMMVDTRPNYFMFNSQTKRNISVQKLTFQIINDKMNVFLSDYASSEGKIWNERVLDNPYLEMPEQFKPLVSYKLLFGLADRDAEAGWRGLENASEETLLFIRNGLEANADKDFAAALAQRTADKPMNIKAARDFLVKNKRYLQSKMTKYVIENIDAFN